MATPIHIGAAGGEYMESVVLVEWRVRPGDPVAAGQVVAVVETAKAATEVEAPCDGVMGRLLVPEGAEVAVQDPIGLVGEDRGDVEGAAGTASAPTAPAAPTPLARETKTPVADDRLPTRPGRPGRLVASPVARRLAAAEGIDLATIAGTGRGGRIKKRDVLVARAATEHGPDGGTDFAEQSGPLAVARSGAASGTLVLMVHGFAADNTVWTPVLRDLSRRHPVLRLELPCHGQSPRQRFASFRALARRVVDAVDALDLDAVHLVGHSLGGAIALALADIRPRLVRSLTLIAPAGLGADIDGAVLDGLCRAARPESLAPWLRRLVADPDVVTDAYVRAAMAARGDPELRAAQAALARLLFPDGTQAADLRAALGRVAVPARIVWGRVDTIIPWRHALAAPGTVALNLLDGVGHMPHLEAPEIVAQLIAETAAAATACHEETGRRAEP